MKPAKDATGALWLGDDALQDLRKVMDACGMDSTVFTDKDLNHIGTFLLSARLIRLKVSHRLNNFEKDGIIKHTDVCSRNTKN